MFENVHVRIEVEAVKQKIISMINSDSAAIEQAVKRALDDFDFDATVQCIVQQELPEVLRLAIKDALYCVKFELAAAIRSNIKIDVGGAE